MLGSYGKVSGVQHEVQDGRSGNFNLKLKIHNFLTACFGGLYFVYDIDGVRQKVHKY